MRDPILDRNSVHLKNFIGAVESARKESNKLPEVDDIVDGLADWCRNVLHKTAYFDQWEEGLSFSQLLALPSGLLPFQAFNNVPDMSRRKVLQESFQEFLENERHVDSNVMAWLLGKALAKVLVECLNNSAKTMLCPVIGFHNFASSHEVSIFAFEESLAYLLQNNPVAFNVILSDIEEHIERIRKDPGIGAYSIDRESYNLMVDSWRSNPTIGELPRTRMNWYPVHYEALNLIPCIMPGDRAAVLDRLDRFDFPQPIRQVLESVPILHDRDEITAMLKTSPSCSDDGKLWNSRLTSLLILETAERHCEELWRAVGSEHSDAANNPAVLEETKETLSSWLLELGDIVMKRPDGRFLGSQWMLLKIADERADRARRGNVQGREPYDFRQDDLIEWIALDLSKAGLTGNDVDALVEFPEMSNPQNKSPMKPAETDTLPQAPCFAALCVSTILDHMVGDKSQNNVQQLLGRFDALLAHRDPVFETECTLATNSPGIPENCIGYLISMTEDPSERWQKSWNLLAEQRRRAQHWRQTQDGDALATSHFLINAGTAAIRWLLWSEEHSWQSQKSLWQIVFDASRECWLTIAVARFTGLIESQIGRLFVLHPQVFNPSRGGNDSLVNSDNMTLEDAYIERLAADLSELGGDDTILTACFLNAHYNGTSLNAMRKVLMWNDRQIDRVLKQFEKWQEVERSVRQKQSLLSELKTFRTNIRQLENR